MNVTGICVPPHVNLMTNSVTFNCVLTIHCNVAFQMTLITEAKITNTLLCGLQSHD